MALPKRRQSKTRRDKRRSHLALTEPNLPHVEGGKSASGRSKRFICRQCGYIKQSHRICPNCGYYNNRQVIKVSRS